MRAILWCVQVIMPRNIYYNMAGDYEIIDFGLKNYGEILDFQTRLFNNLVINKKEGRPEKEYILLGEHTPVITLGRRAKEDNILATSEILKSRGIEIFHIGRGGDVTYHCPSQLIVYPILDLELHSLGVKSYIHVLEETIIRLLNHYGIKGERVDGATGVWIDKGTIEERKICAIGVKCSRFCTMHGLALNVNSDLRGFSMINPCGFQNKGVTSIEKEIGKKVDMDKVKERFLHIFLGLIFSFEEILDLPE